MNFVEKLKDAAKENNSVLCMGMDPVAEKIPIEGKPEKTITKFFSDILEGMKSEDVFPGMVKPNYAFYAQYGFGGLRAMKEVIDQYKKEGILILLDAKRGDIGKTSQAYGREVFGFWNADAVTIAPYMGSDSVGPFIDYCEKGYGVYILNRTSNKGAVDIQDINADGKPVYMRTSENIVRWHKPGTGVVVGATYPKELEEISSFFVDSGKEVPFLVPGVGSQGGSASEVVAVLKKTKNEMEMHRINSSSGILYAYKKNGTEDYVGAAIEEIRNLNKEIDF
jgi:orotidine-5'-phosphate decarboxylase